MLVGFAEGLGAAKTYATRDHYEIDPNHELVGLGAANLGSGLCSGMVVNGSLSKTAVNASAGARTQVSVARHRGDDGDHAAVPHGALRGSPRGDARRVVIAALIELVDLRALARALPRLYRAIGEALRHAARPDFIAATAAMLGVLFFDTLPGLFIGIATSLLLLLYRASRPHVAELGKVPGTPDQYGDRDRHPENVTVPGVVVERVEGGLFFANADTVRKALRAAATRRGTRAIVIDAESVPFVDVTAVRMLDDLSDELDALGIGLAIAHDLGQVRDMLAKEAGAAAGLRVHPTVQAAVDSFGPRPTVSRPRR